MGKSNSFVGFDSNFPIVHVLICTLPDCVTFVINLTGNYCLLCLAELLL